MKRPRLVVVAACAVTPGLVALAAVLASSSSTGGLADVEAEVLEAARRLPEVSAHGEVTAFLARLGITPRSLAIAGVEAQTVDALVAIARLNFDRDRRHAIMVLDADVAKYTRAKDEVRLARATQSRQTLLDEFRQVITPLLTAEQWETVRRFNANKSWIVPDEYKVLNLSERDRFVLSQGLAVENSGRTPRVDLARFKDDANVVLARSRLQTESVIIQRLHAEHVDAPAPR